MKPVQSWNLLGNYPLHHYAFENGLNAYLIHNPISPVAAFLTHYTVGSASETDSERGLAHFFEHMMFRETDSLGDGDFDRIIAQSGGVGLNAYTSYDTTAYHVSLPTKNLEKVIGLESDRMANLKLSEALIELERGAVLGEMNMYKDMPSEQMWETLTEEAFSPHPYRHPIIGYEDQVRNFAQQDFEQFYRSHYAPNRAVVVVAGEFDEPRLVEALEQAYGHLSPGAPRPAPVPAPPPWSDSRQVEISHAKISTESLMMGWRTPGMTHADLPALTVLAAVLSAGQSSPLHGRIVLEGIGSHASAFVMDAEMMLLSPGMLLVDVGLLHGIPAERAETAVLGLLDTLAREGVSADDLLRAKNQLRLGFHSSLATNMSLARHVGGFVVACGDPEFGETSFRKIGSVNREGVMAVLDTYITSAPRLTLIQRPESGGGP